MINSEEKKFIELIKNSTKIVITTHENPDPDGLCSQIAMYFGLLKLNKQVIMVNTSPTPKMYSFIEGADKIKVYNKKIEKELKKCDLSIIVDTNELKRAGLWLSSLVPQIIAIDHHVKGENYVNGIIKENYNSASELVFEVLSELGVEIDKKIANTIFTGIVFDTRGFQFVKGNPDVFSIAHELVKKGANPDFAYTKMLNSFPFNFLKLLKDYLERLKFINNGKIAWGVVSEDDIVKYGLEMAITQELHPVVMMIEEIEVSVIYKKLHTGKYKISMRSKGNIDVGRIARKFNGGGHKNAAGCETYKNPEDHILEIVNEL